MFLRLRPGNSLNLFDLTNRWHCNKPTKLRRKSTLCVLVWLYVLTLFIFLCCLKLIGERFWVFSLALFVPPHLFLLPAFIVFIICLRLRFLLYFYYTVYLGVIILLFFDFEWSRHSTLEDSISILTHNVGRSTYTSLNSVIALRNPDVIVLQEARPKKIERFYRQHYPSYNVKRVEEFLLVSKWKILESKLIEIKSNGKTHPIACRFEIAQNERRVAIYNVHLPSPRPSLAGLYDFNIITNLLRCDLRGFYHACQSYEKLLIERIDVVKGFRKRLAEEKKPFLAGGDFNFPSHGYLRRLFTAHFGDAFRNQGKGFGWTFPGYVDNDFLGLFGPWMRLDYIFHSRDFQPTYFLTERHKKQVGFSQHLPIIAKFKLN